MSKELPFFKFIATDWLAGDIQVLNLEEQGFFANLCALFWKKKESLPITTLKLRYGHLMTNFDEAIKKLRELEIIVISNNEKVTVLFLEEQFKEQFEKKQKLSDAGKKGAKKKYKFKPPYNHPTTTLQPPINKEEIEIDKEIDKEKNIKKESSLISCSSEEGEETHINRQLLNADKIFEAYPSKAGELKAKQEILKAFEKIEAEFLLARVEAFALHTLTWTLENRRRFIPKAEKYFSEGRYNDDLSFYERYQPQKARY